MLIRRRQDVGLILALLLVFGCGGRLKAPAQLTPVGDVAYYAGRVIRGVESLQQMAIDGEAAGAIDTDDARTIISATKIAGIAGVDLSKALGAGLSETEAKAKAIAVIREALGNLPARLNQHTRDLVNPYVQAVLTMLAFLS